MLGRLFYLFCVFHFLGHAMSAEEGKRLGCFVDAEDRHLSSNKYDNSAMTPKKCASHCNQEGYGYAGVEYKTECYCGNEYGKHAKVAGSECNSECGGDRMKTCGGAWRIEIYQLKPSLLSVYMDDLKICSGSSVTIPHYGAVLVKAHSPNHSEPLNSCKLVLKGNQEEGWHTSSITAVVDDYEDVGAGVTLDLYAYYDEGSTQKLEARLSSSKRIQVSTNAITLDLNVGNKSGSYNFTITVTATVEGKVEANVAMIIGIAVGVLVLMCLFCGGTWFLCYRQNQQRIRRQNGQQVTYGGQGGYTSTPPPAYNSAMGATAPPYNTYMGTPVPGYSQYMGAPAPTYGVMR